MRMALIAAIVLLACASQALAQFPNQNRVHVNGYWKQNGTYVQPHVRTAPDSRLDNNFNPPRGNYGGIMSYR